MSSYEAIRLKNLEDNKRVLASFGLFDPFKNLPCIVKKKTVKPTIKPQPTKKRPRPSNEIDLSGGSIYGRQRKSARLQGKEVSAQMNVDLSTLDDEDREESYTPKVQPNRPNFYGAVPDVAVGTVWLTRMECCRDGVHRPTVAGIHGGEEGAYSIALSGGYEDDLDLGDCFTYTGEGGRDLKGTKSNPKNLRTAPQSRDQTLTRGNLALSKNVDSRKPIRVIRGYKLHSPFAPEEGYRYDGLYTVEKCWFTTGLSGFGVWKFALKRCGDQAPSPWQLDTSSEPGSPTRPSSSDEDMPKQSFQQSTGSDGPITPAKSAGSGEDVPKQNSQQSTGSDELGSPVKSTGEDVPKQSSPQLTGSDELGSPVKLMGFADVLPKQSSQQSTGSDGPISPAKSADEDVPQQNSSQSTGSDGPLSPAKSADEDVPKQNSSQSTGSDGPLSPAKSADEDVPQQNSSQSTGSDGPLSPAKSADEDVPQQNSSQSTGSDGPISPAKSADEDMPKQNSSQSTGSDELGSATKSTGSAEESLKQCSQQSTGSDVPRSLAKCTGSEEDVPKQSSQQSTGSDGRPVRAED